MSIEIPVKKARKGEMSPLLAAVQACTKEILTIKQEMKQKFMVLENNTNFIPATYAALIKRIEALEESQKNIMDSNNHKHDCCDKVNSRLDTIEDILRKIPRSSRFWASKHNEHNNEANKIQMRLETIEELLEKIVKANEFFLPLDELDNSQNKPVVLVSTQKPPPQVSACVSLDSSVQVITLNSESDYPNGSWLGDETNPESRVRCSMSRGELLHVNTFCQSPEKMALTLLDYLFPREVLAVSNLSGKGKHGKKQLDPLMIYGIRCHLLHKFGISEQDWYRIKQNLDSKCRTVWRKKVKGLPLGGVKTQSNSNSEDSISSDQSKSYQPDGMESFILTASPCYDEDDDVCEELQTQVIHTDQGNIKVLHATPQQFARIQEAHHVQVLSEQEFLPVLEGHSHLLDGDDTISEYKTPLNLDCTEISVDVANIECGNKDIHFVNSEILGTTDDLGTIEVIAENMEFIPISHT